MRLFMWFTAMFGAGAAATPIANLSSNTAPASFAGGNSTAPEILTASARSPVAGGCYVGDPKYKKMVPLYGDNWCSGVSSDYPMSVIWVNRGFSCKLYELTPQVCNVFPLLDTGGPIEHMGLHLQKEAWLYNCWRI